MVLLLPFLLAAQDKPAEKCTISGIVVNIVTGDPLDKVEIETEPAGPRGGSAVSVTSDANGHFILPNLEPGQYRLKGKRNRFLDTYYGARRAESSGIPIVVDAGQTVKDLRFKLLPFGVIAGTIRDPEGEPLARVAVTALRLRYEDGRRKVTTVDSTFTDDLGQYRITGLAPGKYYIRANPTLKTPGEADVNVSGFLITMTKDMTITTDGATGVGSTHQTKVLLPALFPGVQEPPAARTVDLETGARVPGIDIALPRSSTVTVTGHVSAPQGAHAGTVSLSRGQWMGNSLDPRLFTIADEHGDFTFPAVPQGTYTLTASATGGRRSTPTATFLSGPNVMVMEGSDISYEGQVPLTVGATPVQGIQVAIAGASEVSGHIAQTDNKEPVLGGAVEFDDGVSDIRRADIRDGHFGLDLPAGHYNVYLSLPTLLIRSVTADGRDIAAEGLTIEGPGKVSLDFVAAPDGGWVEGVVLDTEDKPIAGAKVVLIPEAKFRSRKDRYFEAETDQYGHFEIENVVPGEYKAYAWDDVEPGIWRDSNFVASIESKGEPITLKASGRESTKLHIR
jgi:hypothetical protein